MAEESAKAHPQHEDLALPEPPPRRLVLDLPSWLPLERVPRPVMFAVGAAFILALIIGTTVPFALGWLDESDFRTLGYPGIFLANFLGTATVFVPVPGLTAAGQTLIVVGSRTLWDPGVVLAGAAGMTLAESTAYLAGSVARGVSEEREMPLRGRLGQRLRRAAGC